MLSSLRCHTNFCFGNIQIYIEQVRDAMLGNASYIPINGRTLVSRGAVPFGKYLRI